MEGVHPVLQDMIKLGCKDQMKILQAFQTYLELCEVQVLKDVNYHYSSSLDIIYLSSQELHISTIYIPVSVKEKLAPAWIDSALNEISKNYSQAVFTLVIRGPDSSAVHYKISRGISILPSPEETKEKRILDEKKLYKQNELLMNKSEIYLKAKLLT